MTTRRRIRRSCLAIVVLAVAAGGSIVAEAGTASAIHSSVTHLKSVPHNQTIGNPVALQALVSSKPPMPTGSVQFYEDGTTPLGAPQPVSNRSATLSWIFAAGTHSVTAQYLGDVNTAGSTSTPVAIFVGTPSDTVAQILYHSLPRMPVSQWTASTHVVLVMNIAIVAGETNYGARTGTATFRIDGTTDYTVNVDRSHAVLDLPNGFGSTGPHNFSGQYHGDIHYNPDTAGTRRITILNP
jgi:hypothetical protein